MPQDARFAESGRRATLDLASVAFVVKLRLC